MVDNGLFVEFASLLARSFGKVYLYVPWENAYPKSIQLCVGKGLEGITKIDSIWPVLNEVDLWVFPDVYHGTLQLHLESLGKRVWGSRMGEELELFRVFSKQAIAEVGLAVGEFAVVHGLDALRKYLKKHENRWVKVSRSRGDFETFKSETYQLVEPRLDEIEVRLGALKHTTEFIVEEAIDEAVEIGYDGYSVDGRFPSQAMSGIEIKDKGYVGRFKRYSEMAAPIQEVNEAIAPLLKQYRYRNFWAAEARVTRDGTPWIIDPCARSGSPPSEVAMMMYTNLAEIFWWGAQGEIIDPIPAGEWAAQVMLISGWANHNWQAIDFPAEIRDHVKLHFPVVLDGRYYVTPQGFDLPAIGAVVAVESTLAKAVNKVKRLAEQVRGFYLDAPVDCFESAKEEMVKLAEFGLEL